MPAQRSQNQICLDNWGLVFRQMTVCTEHSLLFGFKPRKRLIFATSILSHSRLPSNFPLTSGDDPIHQGQSVTKILSRGRQGREVAKARPYSPEDTVCHIELWQVSHKRRQKHSQRAQQTSQEGHHSAAVPFTQSTCDWSKQIHDSNTD